MLHYLTLSNLQSYARACAKLSKVTEALARLGYEDMVVPSRGAAPVVHAAQNYFRQIALPNLDRPSDFPDDLDLQGMAREERQSRIRAHSLGPLINPLFLPFTADIPSDLTDVESAQIRRFWAAVLAAIIRKDFADPHYRFFSFLRNEVCKLGFMSSHEWNGFSSKFIFVDTVVSGRAVVEIMEAFEAVGLSEAHFVLLADANGTKIKSPWRARIEAEIALENATLISMDSLFTEDQGPAVSGIWSVTMPNLMTVVRDAVPDFSRTGVTGAGLYYTEVRAREDKKNLNTTIAIARLSRLIEMCWRPDLFPDPWIEEEIEVLRQHLQQHKLLSEAVTLETAKPRLLSGSLTKVELETSPSHALRLVHGRDVAHSLVKKFKTWQPPLPPVIPPRSVPPQA